VRFTLARRRSAIYLTAVIVTAVGVFARTPFSLIAPGHALDLRNVVTIAGHAPPATHYYMTDVGFIPHVSPFGLVAALEPGWQLVRSEDYQPAGIDDATYDRVMTDAMSQSQEAAIYVAERAAGLSTRPATTRVIVVSVLPASHARNLLRDGDELLGLDHRAIDSAEALATALGRLSPGERAVVDYARDGHRLQATFATIDVGGKARLGVGLQEIATLPKPPVKVRYNIGRISGSSGGVMFALEIYRSFRPADTPATLRIAGTGTIDANGSVGPIAGTVQKVIAAQRAGATLFLVPAENYVDVRSVRGITIVPIHTFGDAVRATVRQEARRHNGKPLTLLGDKPVR
jgi:PDZ domain-containing protein